MKKQAGLLFPISVLPGRYGVGDFGQHAYELVDKMASASITLWQILPLNPLGYGNSPYQPLSTHAGDEIYLSLAGLVEDNLLLAEEVTSFHTLYHFVDYKEVRHVKEKLYLKAFERFEETDEYQRFVKENDWVHLYAVFKVFKDHNHQKSWVEWEDEYKYYYRDLSFSLTPFLKEINYQIFLQYYFFKQWNALKNYANQKGISIIGDMPIYVGLDSVDVWVNQQCFLLEEDGKPSFVAGVPPDYFSKFGQRWGNPLYDWEYLSKHQFDFWVERMKAASQIYDTVRIDHFRAFDTYWSVPYGSKTASEGKWIEGPSYHFLDSVYKQLPELNMIVEDLGELRPEVHELRDHYHLLGMKVMQFSFGEDERKVKYKIPKQSVVYTGTHDNAPLKQWYDELEDKEFIKEVMISLGYKGEDVIQDILSYAFDCDALIAMLPVQDLLGYGKEARVNLPGTVGSYNWSYRLTSFDDYKKKLKDIKKMIDKSKR